MKITCRLFGGILLIGAGIIALLQSLGYVDQLAPQLWIAIFAGICLVALVAYALNGWKEWGWLFFVGVFGGLALTLAIAITGETKSYIATPLFVGLVIPFAAAYLTDRARNWWALIPGGIMLFLALTTLIADSTGGEWIGALSLLVIAIGFLAAYLNNRRRTWALLVAYIFAVISIAPLMSATGRNADYFGVLLLVAIALPFFVVYFRSVVHWWAIIPAGVLTTVAVIVTLAISHTITSQTEDGYVSAFMMSGLAATFAMVGWRHSKTWARGVTMVLVAMAVASLLFFSQTPLIGALAIIVLGGYLLVTALHPKTA